MSFPGYEDNMYKTMMKSYKIHGENSVYNNYKIIDMDNNQINKEIYLINNSHYFEYSDPRTRGWLEIFENVLIKRRINKIKKIKSKIV